MKYYSAHLIVFVLFCILLAACGPSQVEENSISNQVAADTFAAQTALAPSDTPIPAPTDTATPVPSATPLPSATPNLSQTAIVATRQAFLATRQVELTATAVAARATQQAEDDAWAQLVKDGAVSYSKGELFTPEDFDESWAQRDWYRWWPFSYDLANFVLMSHIEWEIPEDAVWGLGGCGFLARIKDRDNHLVIFLSPKGNVELGGSTPNGVYYQGVHWQNPDLPNYTTLRAQLTGSADFTLVVEKEFVTVYVNGVKFYQWYVALTSPGDIAYTIVSGTNKDFGIKCKMTNTRIWELVK